MMRQALVATTPSAAEAVARYLPSNYAVVSVDSTGVLIRGEDNAGWTLDGYVIPRLASGLYFAVECQHDLSEPCTPA